MTIFISGENYSILSNVGMKIFNPVFCVPLHTPLIVVYMYVISIQLFY